MLCSMVQGIYLCFKLEDREDKFEIFLSIVFIRRENLVFVKIPFF